MQELSGVSEGARELAMSHFRLIHPHLEKNRPLQLVATDSKLPKEIDAKVAVALVSGVRIKRYRNE
jgi:hypothetical protein